MVPHGGLRCGAWLQFLKCSFERTSGSFNHLHDAIIPYLQTHLVVVDRQNNEEGATEFWASIGCPADMLDVAVTLDPQISGSDVCVQRGSLSDAELVMHMSSLLLGAMRIQVASDSRWLSVGSSCRWLLFALACGLQGLVAYARQMPQVSNFYLQAFDKLDGQLLEFIMITAVVSWVPDGVQTLLLKDDRLMLILNDVQECIDDERAWLSTLSMAFWLRLALLPPSKVNAHALMGNVTHASYVASAYMRHNSSTLPMPLHGHYALDPRILSPGYPEPTGFWRIRFLSCCAWVLMPERTPNHHLPQHVVVFRGTCSANANLGPFPKDIFVYEWPPAMSSD